MVSFTIVSVNMACLSVVTCEVKVYGMVFRVVFRLVPRLGVLLGCLASLLLNSSISVICSWLIFVMFSLKRRFHFQSRQTSALLFGEFGFYFGYSPFHWLLFCPPHSQGFVYSGIRPDLARIFQISHSLCRPSLADSKNGYDIKPGIFLSGCCNARNSPWKSDCQIKVRNNEKMASLLDGTKASSILVS